MCDMVWCRIIWCSIGTKQPIIAWPWNRKILYIIIYLSNYIIIEISWFSFHFWMTWVHIWIFFKFPSLVLSGLWRQLSAHQMWKTSDTHLYKGHSNNAWWTSHPTVSRLYNLRDTILHSDHILCRIEKEKRPRQFILFIWVWQRLLELTFPMYW